MRGSVRGEQVGQVSGWQRRAPPPLAAVAVRLFT